MTLAGETLIGVRLDDGRLVIPDTLCAQVARLPLVDFVREAGKLPAALREHELVIIVGAEPVAGRSFAWLDALAELHADDVPAPLSRLWRAALSRLEDELAAEDEDLDDDCDDELDEDEDRTVLDGEDLDEVDDA